MVDVDDDPRRSQRRAHPECGVGAHPDPVVDQPSKASASFVSMTLAVGAATGRRPEPFDEPERHAEPRLSSDGHDPPDGVGDHHVDPLHVDPFGKPALELEHHAVRARALCPRMSTILGNVWAWAGSANTMRVRQATPSVTNAVARTAWRDIVTSGARTRNVHPASPVTAGVAPLPDQAIGPSTVV